MNGIPEESDAALDRCAGRGRWPSRSRPAARSAPRAATRCSAHSTSAAASRIGASVAVETADNKDAKAGVSIETVEPGGPADKAGIKAGDAVTEFDGERVRSVRQFLRLVQETTPGRSVPVVLSRARTARHGQRHARAPVAVGTTSASGTSTRRWPGWRFRRARPRPRRAGGAARAASARIQPVDAVRVVRAPAQRRTARGHHRGPRHAARGVLRRQGGRAREISRRGFGREEGRTESGRRDHVGQRPAHLRLVRRDARDRSRRGQTATSRSK